MGISDKWNANWLIQDWNLDLMSISYDGNHHTSNASNFRMNTIRKDTNLLIPPAMG